MRTFMLTVSYLSSPEEVERHLPAHIAWLEEQYERKVYLLFARKLPFTGGVCFAVAESADQIAEITETDPFRITKVAKYDIQELDLTKVNTISLLEHASHQG
ncbi:Dimeric alpha-beta barrel [Penicillium camemberti]|uniref:Dimeric alpha-beta barrel n=1 Tax=Penicillium camemberti (strain FM 013) TaxID=1429867 RepID=A0A0G4P6A2_PENC3|nr:Dimeric alpha-beta barrel [Penicillium camemberti]